jgi:hypothetical protein
MSNAVTPSGKKLLLPAMLLSLVFALSPGKASGQFYAIKTDLVTLSTGNLNIEGSALLNLRWSAHVPVVYNPFTYGDYQLKNISLMPGVRYWFTETYTRGWFAGANAVASYYNIRFWGKEEGWQGLAFGGGLSGGYSMMLSKRVNLEFELGGAAVWTTYDRYECNECRKKTGTGSGVRFIPDKTAISLVFLF